MKKTLLVLLLGTLNTLMAQMPTHFTEYTISAGSIAGAASAHVYNGRVYTAVSNGTIYSLQKNSLNSVPLVSKDFTGLLMDGQDQSKPNFISGASGLYMTGRINASQKIYLTKLDTVSLNPIFTRTYTVGNYSMHAINQAGLLNSGNILIVGSAGNTNANEVGFILSVNPSANGAVVYSSTLSVASSTYNGIYSFAEISNSSVLLSALSSNGSSLIKALKIGSTFSIIPSSSTNVSYPAFRLFKFGNPKKLIAANISAICKIDTNVNIIASTPISQQISRLGSWPNGDVYHNNGRTYHYAWGNNNVEVFDTALVSVATKTIAYNAMLSRDVTNSANNMYLVQTLLSPISPRYILLKTDLNAGNMLCLQDFTVSKSVVNLASFAITINTNSVTTNLGFENPVSSGPLALYTQTCINTCAAPSAPANSTPSVNLTICANNSATLSATGSGTINWFTSPTGTAVVGTGSVLVTPTLTAGTYTYYAEATTCTNSISRTVITVTVAACTGIVELDRLSFTKIYPNPNNGNFKIYLEESVNVEVIDALGKTVFEENLPGGESSININDVEPGIYFVKLRSNTAKKTFKIIKN